MVRELWFRSEGDHAGFDWQRAAQDLEVPAEIARTLFQRAMQRMAELGPDRAEALLRGWLREAAATVIRDAEAKAKAKTPGRQTRVGARPNTRDARDVRTWDRAEREKLDPGRWTRTLLEPEQAANDEVSAGAADPRVSRDEVRAMMARLVRSTPSLRGAALEQLTGARSAADALPSDLAGKLGPHLGQDAVGAARVHTGETADVVAQAHAARALTVGTDIYFARGAYQPGTAHGDELIAHELTHVAQGQRGELGRAAAKGVDSGNQLDPAEAEADLRARLAVIEIHAPDGAPTALAQPTAEPTTDGARSAALAAQQQRLSIAGQASQPIATQPAPAPITPAAPTAHQAPAMPAVQAAPSTGNAYVDTLNAAPSKQATELWSKAGEQETGKVATDDAKFAATLPTIPVVLDGKEAPAKAPAAAGGKEASPGPTPGAAPPAAQPTPTVVPPKQADATAAAQKVQPVADKAQMKANAQQVFDNLPTTAPNVDTNPGPAPVTDLAQQSDPVRTQADHQHAIGEAGKALDDAKTKIISGPGAAQVQPAHLDEKIKIPAPAPTGAMPALPTVPGMDKFKKLNLPVDARAAFDDVAKPKMDAHLTQAKAKMTEAETTRDAARTKAVNDAQDKVKQANADADKQQQQKVADSRTQIANHQASTAAKQEAEIKKLDQQSGDKKKGALQKINDRVQADQNNVAQQYKDAQTQADAKKKQGEADAAKKKQEAEDKKKDESWWDRAADAVCDAIKDIANEIDSLLDQIGKAIGDLLNAVKDAACKLIDAARDFVCQALSEFGDWLKSAVTALIGSVFPQLAAELNQLIDQAVNAAKSAVNAIADGLKKAVSDLCDSLKGALDALIATFKAAVQAAATFAQAMVTGDWSLVGKMILDGILKLLGIDPAAFYALIGSAEDSIEKIIANPGAFVGHLIDAVKLGFQQFGAHFLTHLKDGVVQWLFGTFASAGITLPAQFDVAGIFDLVCQVLGLTWTRLRPKVVSIIGEKNTEKLEFAEKYIEALMTGGFAGLWAQVQQDMGGLWDMVIGGVQSWLMEKVVQQAIIKLATMWNPVGAIIQLIETAWNVYCWVKENAQRIFGLVQAVVDSMANIVAGNISGAANFIEASLAKLVPIAISLFADLIGLGGIADKIRAIIEKIQAKVDSAIDKLIERVSKMFKGKDTGGAHDPAHGDAAHADGKDGKDGKDPKAAKDGKDGKDGKDPKADPNKPVGTRVAFNAHGEAHTQFIDPSGVPMVASTPAPVKSKIEEWRPRLRELKDADQKKAGGLIGKAIAIEKNVATLVKSVKDGKASEADLEAKQRQLADTLAGLFEIMAPDMDPSKSFAQQDPRATLKSPQYNEFKGRFNTLATSIGMPGGLAAAQELWLKVVEALQHTDAAYAAAPNAGTSGRKDLSSDAFQKIMKDFEPITTALHPYMERFAAGKKSWAFWSGKPAVEVAKGHAEVCLEKSALGSLFDGININGGWDIQMWASLSKAYATHAAAHIGEAQFSGFVGLGSSADQSIFNKIEQPQFVGMLNDHQRATLHIDWYACACDPSNIGKPDARFTGGGIPGTYGKGDRAGMVALAESENKRRIDLFKSSGVNEGPGGTTGATGGGLDKPVSAPTTMDGAAHTVVAKPGGSPSVELHSVPGTVKDKTSAATANVRKANPSDAPARLSALANIASHASEIENLLRTKGTGQPAVESAVKTLGATIASYGTTYKAKELDEVGDVVEVPKTLVEPQKVKLPKVSAELEAEAGKTASGTMLYQGPAGDPKQVTKDLLASHPDAKYDKATGALTLPPVNASDTSSLRGLAVAVAHSTGVSKITFVVKNGGWQLDGTINPTVEALASYPTLGNGLDPLIASLKDDIGKQQPNRDLLVAICRERAQHFQATVTFTDVRRIPPGGTGPRPLVTEVHFTKGSETWDVDIVQVSKDDKCPSCGALVGPGGADGSKPHNVIPASMWGAAFDTTFTRYGIDIANPDQFYQSLRGMATETGGKAVTPDKQCRACETTQDNPPGGGQPASLVQRGDSSVPNKTAYVGHQFAHTSKAQMLEITKVKVEAVIATVRAEMARPPSKAAGNRPTNSTIYKNIVDPGKTNTVLAELEAEILQKASV